MRAADERRLLIGESDFRLKNIEARHRPGLEAILLIFQLTFEQANRFLLHTNERFVQDDLIKLLTHESDDLIDGVAKGEVGAVLLKVRAPDRWKGRAGENQLRGLDAKKIGVVRAEPVNHQCRLSKTWTAQMRIGALKLVGRHYVWQHLREDFDEHAIGAPDLLARAQDVGILLQRRLNRLIEREWCGASPGIALMSSSLIVVVEDERSSIFSRRRCIPPQTKIWMAIAVLKNLCRIEVKVR